MTKRRRVSVSESNFVCKNKMSRIKFFPPEARSRLAHLRKLFLNDVHTVTSCMELKIQFGSRFKKYISVGLVEWKVVDSFYILLLANSVRFMPVSFFFPDSKNDFVSLVLVEKADVLFIQFLVSSSQTNFPGLWNRMEQCENLGNSKSREKSRNNGSPS